MATILTAVGSVFTAMFGASGYVATLVGVITANDYLLIGVSLMIVGSVIGFLARIIHST